MQRIALPLKISLLIEVYVNNEVRQIGTERNIHFVLKLCVNQQRGDWWRVHERTGLRERQAAELFCIGCKRVNKRVASSSEALPLQRSSVGGRILG